MKDGTADEVVKQAKTYMDLTLRYEEIRRGNYRKNDLHLAEGRMVDARRTLFDAILFREARQARAVDGDESRRAEEGVQP